MKKLKRLLLGVLVLLIIGAGLFYFAGEETRDRFNPFIKEKDVYALINKQGVTDPDFTHRYMFLVDSVDQAGNTEKIKVTSSVKDFPPNCYLKVHVKGKYVYDFDKIMEEGVPKKVREKLQKQQTGQNTSE